MARTRTSRLITFLWFLLKGLIVGISLPIPQTIDTRRPIIGHCTLPDDSATIIYLDGCGLSELPYQLKDYTNLRVLFARNNNIKHIDVKLISELKNLQEFYINHNQISEFPHLINPSIKRIDIAFNIIKKPLNPDLFKDLNNCKNIDLTGNGIGVCDESKRLNREANATCKIKCSSYPWETTNPPRQQPTVDLSSSQSPTVSSKPSSTPPPLSSTSPSVPTSVPTSTSISTSTSKTTSTSTYKPTVPKSTVLPENRPESGLPWLWIIIVLILVITVVVPILFIKRQWIKNKFCSDRSPNSDLSSESSETFRSDDGILL